MSKVRLDSKVTNREYNGKKIRIKIFDADDDKNKECIKKGTVYFHYSLL